MKKNIFIGIYLIICVLTVSAQEKSLMENLPGQKFVYDSEWDKRMWGFSPERLVYIDNLLQEYVDKGIIPQAITFVAKNGIVIHNKTYGWSDIAAQKPVKKDDIFRNFSQTKAIVTVALLTLFEQGKFQLDDPVSMYIPECTDQVLEKINDDGSAETRKVASPLTIRNLLTHTSGILGNRDIAKLRDEQMKQRNNHPYETLAEEVKYLVQLPLAFDPGTNWNYHPSIDVCGYLVEYFSGKPMRTYIKETIFEPLGMTESDWYYPENYRNRFVKAYTEKDGKLVEEPDKWSGRNPFSADTRYTQAGTGLNGTIEDYARFCQMILNYGTFNGKRILGRKTVEMMTVNQLPQPNNGGPDFQFGIGFEINPDPKEMTVHRDVVNFTPLVSPGALNWGGAYNTDYLIDHKENMIILLYTNRVPDTKIWEKFLNTVYQALE